MGHTRKSGKNLFRKSSKLTEVKIDKFRVFQRNYLMKKKQWIPSLKIAIWNYPRFHNVLQM